MGHCLHHVAADRKGAKWGKSVQPRAMPSSEAVVLPTPALFQRSSLQAQGTSSPALTGSCSAPRCHCLCILVSSLPGEMRTALCGEVMVWPVWIPDKPSTVFNALWANVRSSRPCGLIVTVKRLFHWVYTLWKKRKGLEKWGSKCLTMKASEGNNFCKPKRKMEYLQIYYPYIYIYC